MSGPEEEPRCPVCGERCSLCYVARGGRVLGCEHCALELPAFLALADPDSNDF